jgi:hypothetical protein
MTVTAAQRTRRRVAGRSDPDATVTRRAVVTEGTHGWYCRAVTDSSSPSAARWTRRPRRAGRPSPCPQPPRAPPERFHHALDDREHHDQAEPRQHAEDRPVQRPLAAVTWATPIPSAPAATASDTGWRSRARATAKRTVSHHRANPGLRVDASVVRCHPPPPIGGLPSGGWRNVHRWNAAAGTMI